MSFIKNILYNLLVVSPNIPNQYFQSMSLFSTHINLIHIKMFFAKPFGMIDYL